MPLALTIQKWLLVEYKDDFKLYSKYLEKKPPQQFKYVSYRVSGFNPLKAGCDLSERS